MTLRGLIENDLFLGHVIPDLAHNIAETVRGNRRLTFSGPQGTSMKRNVVTDLETANPKRLRSTYQPTALFRSDQPTFAPMPMRQRTARRTVFRTNLGRKAGKYSTRRVATQGDKNNLGDKRTHWARLIEIPHGTEDSINRRKAALVHLKGIKLRAYFRLKNEGEGQPLYNLPLQVRWAIINPKENLGADLTSTQLPTDFFINENPSLEMAKSFPATGKCWDYFNRKINRAKYGVLKEGQFILRNDVGSNGTRLAAKALHQLSIWIPINRQMKWANDATSFPEQNVYFCWWYAQQGDNTDLQKFATGLAIDEHHERINYFTNSRMFN